MDITPIVWRNPAGERAIAVGAAMVGALMIAAGLAQIVIALLNSLPLFGMTAIVTVLLSAPIWMRSAITPEGAIDGDGITLRSPVWGERRLAWDDVQALKPFPLLPTRDQEVGRRAFVGRAKYQQAAGVMLIVPGLPFAYRFAGWFAGERGVPVFALTNRAHSGYDRLVTRVIDELERSGRAGVIQLAPLADAVPLKPNPARPPKR